VLSADLAGEPARLRAMDKRTEGCREAGAGTQEQRHVDVREAIVQCVDNLAGLASKGPTRRSLQHNMRA